MNKKINTATIGGRIKSKRILLGFSQEKLSELLMIKQNTLSNYENDIRDVPTDILAAMSRILDTTPSYLVLGSGEEDGWINEMQHFVGVIKNPKLRDVALKQIQALALLDRELS